MSDDTTGSGTTPDAQLDLDDELQQLLKEQEDFLRESKRPAAKVSRVGPARTNDHKPPPPKEEEDQPPVVGPQVLGSVVERDIVELNIRNVNVMPRTQAGGFPAVQRRGESLFGKRQRQPGTTGVPSVSAAVSRPSKPSRFSAMRTKSHVAEQEKADETQAPPLDPERQEIDRSNRAQLAEMSTSEIRQAQQDLLASLDPVLVEKLMKRKKEPVTTAKTSTVARAINTKRSLTTSGTGVSVVAGKTVVVDDDEEEDKTTAGVGHTTGSLPPPPPARPLDLSKIQSEDDLRTHAQLLPPDERAKHEWMQSPSSRSSSRAGGATTKTRPTKHVATTERFDFDGEYLETGRQQDAIPTHSGLFHHGDEPEAAGYTMGELVHLARSTVASQRAMALTTVAKVLRKREALVANGNLAAVVPRVLPSDLSVTLRIALDDQNYSALSAAVTALHAFLVPSSGPPTSQLDGRFGLVVPPPRTHLHPNVLSISSGSVDLSLSLETPPTEEVVYIATDEADDGSSIADAELAFLDPVQGLLHMDIGTRLRFVLASVQLPDPRANAKILDVLVHIASHSPRAAEAIGTNATLVSAVQRTFLESDDVLTLANDAALALAVQALVFVRVLCQGSRDVATVLITTGVIQSTKGFLAVQPASPSPTLTALFQALQVESLRVWRVLLAYGLDFHCFAYLYPVLCGFAGADLVRPTGEQIAQEEMSSSRPTASLPAALFAALEALCGLQTVHEAQHYFAQLDVFVRQAKDQVLAWLGRGDSVVADSESDASVVAAALHFLAAAAAFVTKFHLDRSSFVAVFQRLHADSADVWASLAARDDNVEVLTAAMDFHQRVLVHDLVGDDTDDADAASAFLGRVKPLILATAARSFPRLGRTALERATASAYRVPQLCHLLTLTSDLLAAAPRRYEDDAFVAALYAHALSLMEAFVRGHEFWLGELLTTVLFRPSVLQRVGLFPNEPDAVAAARVLVPVYHALVNASAEQETHSRHQFATAVAVAVADAPSPTRKSSCQLRRPQSEDAYVGANLPLPVFWLFSPLSRTEFVSSSSGGASDPTRAESDEMKLVVSATCRFLSALETTLSATSSSSVWRGVDVAYKRDLRPEDKFFHLLHVFFAGADVLFDPHVDVALAHVVRQFVAPVVLQRTDNPTLLFDAMLRNLRQFQRLDPTSSAGAVTSTSTSSGGASTAFATDEQVVLTFVEKLVAEFTSSSFGNAHFARCVTLLLASDFPVAIRRWLWRELAACRLLSALEPPLADSDYPEVAAATFVRCTQRAAATPDEQLVQAMAHALSQQQVTATRGAFAFAVAVHHVTVYLFGDDTGATLSFARQLLAQELVRDAPVDVWRCLLSYEPNDSSDAATATATLKHKRVVRITTQAALSPEQLTVFARLCDAATTRQDTTT